MSSLPKLAIETREKSGTGPARHARRNGFVPGVLYGQEVPTPIQIKQSTFAKEISHPGIMMRVYEVTLGNETFKGLVRAIDRDVVTELPLHFDLQRITDKTSLKLSVPLKFINREKCPGLKRGGVLSVIHHTLQVKCLAEKIVDSIVIDLDGAPVGKSIRFSDITLPEGMSFMHQRMQDTVYTIIPPKVKGKDAAAQENSAA